MKHYDEVKDSAFWSEILYYGRGGLMKERQ